MKKIKELLKKCEILHYLVVAIKGYRKEEIRDYLLKTKKHQYLCLHNWDNYGAKPLYYIKVGTRARGFFAMLLETLDALVFADMLGLESVIEYSNECMYASKGDGMDPRRVFDYYYRQPFIGKIESLSEQKYINYDPMHREYAYSGLSNPDVCNTYVFNDEDNNIYIQRVSEMYKKHIRFNNRTKEYLDKNINKMLASKKTLGVHVRGGEWRIPVKGHPMPVSLDEHIEHVKEVFNKYQFEQIFLASDEKDAIERFKKEFGSKVVYYEDTFRGEAGHWILSEHSSRENHNYLLGLEVLRDAETMVHCQGLIAGLSNVSFYVQMKKKVLNEEFEYASITSKGVNQKGRIARKVAIEELSR
ncbi:MAG: O-fucosyltransferase family protein [Prevotella sp.]|nr:O-fucosyltransferase family protein [Prevotella sp.]